MPWQNLYVLLLSVFILSACGKGSHEEVASSLPEVVVVNSQSMPYKGSFRFVGRLEATASVNIAAQVTGFIIERSFKEGTWVDKGDQLFLIDRQPFEAELRKANAQLEAADAKYRTTKRDYKRSKSLVKSGTISQSDYDRSEGRYLDAKANVALANAEVSSAQLDLNYSNIVAPISGRVGSKNVDVGDLVSPTAGTLTTIKSLNPIQVNFQVDEKTFLAANRQRLKEESKGEKAKDMQVFLELSNGDEYPEAGVISFVDNHINQETGTIAVRADVPNKDFLLLPGQYVKAIVRSPVARALVAVQQSALMKDQQGDYLYVVNATDTVKRKDVVLGDRVGIDVFIISGLEEGEQVIIKGLQKVRPELQVKIIKADKKEKVEVIPVEANSH